MNKEIVSEFYAARDAHAADLTNLSIDRYHRACDRIFSAGGEIRMEQPGRDGVKTALIFSDGQPVVADDSELVPDNKRRLRVVVKGKKKTEDPSLFGDDDV